MRMAAEGWGEKEICTKGSELSPPPPHRRLYLRIKNYLLLKDIKSNQIS